MSSLPTAVANAIKARIKAGAATQGFFGHPTWYPVQFDETASGETNHGTGKTATYYGELRGYYPNYQGYFQPWNSAYHAQQYNPTNQPQGEPPLNYRKHNGVDLYAPYHPFPLEIPVYALMDGKLSQRSQFNQWNPVGNRADLEFWVKIAGTPYRVELTYAHLSRFAPAPEGRRIISATRFRVKAGDLIGFIGKSGNADRQMESSGKDLEFKVNAAHIHVGIRVDYVAQDPYPLLDERFAYHPNRDELFPTAPNEELESKGKHFLPSVFGTRLRDEMPKVKPIKATLRAGTQAGIRVSAQKPDGNDKRPSRVPFPSIFRAIDTNNTRHLRATELAYILATRRLSSSSAASKEHIRYALKGPVDPDDTEKMREPWLASYLGDAKADAWSDTLEDYAERARDHAAKMVADEETRTWHLCAAFHVLHEGLWVLMLGPAFSGFCRGWYHPDPSRRYGEPQTGIGLRGRVLATQFQESVVALHFSALPQKSAKIPPPPPLQMFSVTFGSGGLRHATLPRHVVFPMNSRPRAYVYQVIRRIYHLLFAMHEKIRTYPTALQKEANAKKVKRWIEMAADRMTSTSENHDPRKILMAELTKSDAPKEFFAPIAKVNEEMFQQATLYSKINDDILPPHQPDLEWIGHSGDLIWSKETGEARYG